MHDLSVAMNGVAPTVAQQDGVCQRWKPLRIGRDDGEREARRPTHPSLTDWQPQLVQHSQGTFKDLPLHDRPATIGGDSRACWIEVDSGRPVVTTRKLPVEPNQPITSPPSVRSAFDRSGINAAVDPRLVRKLLKPTMKQA